MRTIELSIYSPCHKLSVLCRGLREACVTLTFFFLSSFIGDKRLRRLVSFVNVKKIKFTKGDLFTSCSLPSAPENNP